MTKSYFAIHYAVQHPAEHSVNVKLLNSAGQKIAGLCSRLLRVHAGNGCVSLIWHKLLLNDRKMHLEAREPILMLL